MGSKIGPKVKVTVSGLEAIDAQLAEFWLRAKSPSRDVSHAMFPFTAATGWAGWMRMYCPPHRRAW